MKVGLIGCGRMGRALAVGAIEAGAVNPADLTVFDVAAPAVDAIREEHDVTAASSVREVIATSDVLLLCTKPHDVPAVLQEIADSGAKEKGLLLISVAAGVTLETIERYVFNHARVIRTMPNTPALIGKGAAAFALGSSANPEDAETTRRLLGSVGTVVQVPERLMDAVTGLSGSGPAYVYVLIEALADGGVLNGIPRDQALQLATQTVLGAASMVRATGEHPATLKDMVASPGGTTMAGLQALEDGGFRAALIDAVTTATRRSLELGED